MVLFPKLTDIVADGCTSNRTHDEDNYASVYSAASAFATNNDDDVDDVDDDSNGDDDGDDDYPSLSRPSVGNVNINVSV